MLIYKYICVSSRFVITGLWIIITWTVLFSPTPPEYEMGRRPASAWPSSSSPLSNHVDCRSVKRKSVAQPCPAFYDPMDCSPPGSSVRRILQAKVLEWVAISSSRGYSQPKDWTQVSRISVRHFTVWAIREDPLSTIVYHIIHTNKFPLNIAQLLI